MMIIKKNLLRYIAAFLICQYCLTVCFSANAQDSSHIRISLLTCAPGEDLYSIFGHSALRVVDSSSGYDIVFNYGTFNFNEEDFYIKFMRGKLLYFLSTEYFLDFRNMYLADNRSIREQVLELNAAEKLTLRQKLIENLQEDKKYYLYDFFLDNCTTRLRDLIAAGKNPTPVLPATMPTNTTFRNAIHQYLDKGGKAWSKLGIDILLGAKTDAVMTIPQQQFLPDNLTTSIDSCKNVTLIRSIDNFPATARKDNSGYFTPLFFFSSLLLLMTLLNYPGQQKTKQIARAVENLVFFITGLLGILLILMWTGTDHKMTKDNYNLLWAWPLNLIMVMLGSKNKWVRQYFLLQGIFLCLTLIAWFFLPQKMNSALLPMVVLLALLSLRRSRRLNI